MMRRHRSTFFALMSTLVAAAAACTGLRPRVFDAGTVVGTDAGAGLDAGADAGAGAGADAGSGADAGLYAGADAGADAGPDAGADAGADESCDAGVRPLGCGCTLDTQCAPKFCTDGVCCDTVAAGCSGCRACNIEGHVGTCTAVPVGQDPHDTCTGQLEACQLGECDGDGGCSMADAGTSCGTPTCVNTPATGQYAAATLGLPLCADETPIYCDPGSTPCADGGICESSGLSCKQFCSLDADCIQGHFCNETTYRCSPQKENNIACTRDRECQSNVCAAGYCRACATNADCTPIAPACSGGSCLSCLPATGGGCPDAGFGGYCGPASSCACITGGCTNARAPRCLGSAPGTCVCGGTGGPCPREDGTICTSNTETSECKVAPENPCVASTDCSSGACDAGKCTRLEAGKPCRGDSDCLSSTCVSGVCQN